MRAGDHAGGSAPARSCSMQSRASQHTPCYREWADGNRRAPRGRLTRRRRRVFGGMCVRARVCAVMRGRAGRSFASFLRQTNCCKQWPIEAENHAARQQRSRGCMHAQRSSFWSVQPLEEAIQAGAQGTQLAASGCSHARRLWASIWVV